MGSLRKATCTPEEWAEYLRKCAERRLANHEQEKARLREYNARPEVRARRRAYEMRDDVKAKRQARESTKEARQQAKARRKQIRNDPDRWSVVLERQRRNRTGFSSQLIAELMEAQDGKCAVCRRDFEGRQVRADHCHDKNQPRGLLCHHCNIIEGMLKSMALSPEEFGERLSQYLANPPADRHR